ncbi:MAG: HAMP domain-containing protein [Treponema sp.]|nr:HAMP domain-containing protein [Treponema sp.]
MQMGLVIYNTRRSVSDIYSESIKELTTAYSSAIANKIEALLNNLYYYTEADIIETGDTEQIVEWMKDHASHRAPDFDYMLYADSTGTFYTDIGGTGNITERSYFKDIVKNGKNIAIDNPTIAKSTGKPCVHICRAAKRNGKTIGLFCGIYTLNTLQQYIGTIKLGETGFAWLIDNTGMVGAHKVTDLVMNKNFLTNPDDTEKQLSQLVQKMVQGQTGGDLITVGKTKQYVAYSPITNTTWSVVFSVEQSQIMESAVTLIKTLSTTSIGIILILVGMSIVIILKALRPLIHVQKTIEGIASGNADLTQRIHIKSNNEIGAVVEGFNSFIEKLQSIITQIKNSKNDLGIAGEDLSASSEDTSSAITQILDNIESVTNQINMQSNSVQETAGAVNEISSNIESLERMIESQSSGVSQASAAVEQMIGNIASVNQSVEKMAESFSELRTHAQNGSQKQDDVNERIEEIESQSDMLQEANQAIANIASQTNLLAMNAAIEAAHAGDAGKGFSVVADEIRKLSETSTAQSKTIGEQLTKIRDSISSVVTASAESSQTFKNVATMIQGTDQLVIQIKGAMEEQQIGSRQINDTLRAMNDSTLEVKTASREMTQGNKQILQQVRNLQEATMTMKDSINEMAAGARKINETGAALKDVTSKLNNSINDIGTEIDAFKV